MKHLRFYFDVISPFACIAFERLPRVLDGLSVSVDYQPVLFASMLSHWGQKGPAEIEPKRAWTFRHVAWQAHRDGIGFPRPDPDRQVPIGALLLQDHDALIGLEIDPYGLHDHLDQHGPAQLQWSPRATRRVVRV